MPIIFKVYLFQKYFAEKIFNKIKDTSISANQITFLRFIAGTIVCLLLITKGDYFLSLIAVIILFFLSVLDVLDGLIARYKNQMSELGRFYDDTLDFMLLLILLGSIYWGYLLNKEPFLTINFICFLFFYILINALLVEFDSSKIPNIYQRTFDSLFFEKNNIDKKKLNKFDHFLIAIIDPNQNTFSALFFNLSYLIFFGFVANIIKYIFIILSIAFLFRSLILIYIISSLKNDKKNPFLILNILKEKLNKL